MGSRDMKEFPEIAAVRGGRGVLWPSVAPCRRDLFSTKSTPGDIIS